NAPEDLAVAREQRRAEVEQLDLLRVILAREHDLEIREHAPIRAAPLKGAEALARELRLRHEGGQTRGDENRDGPRREREQQTRETRERDGVLRQREGTVHERKRPDGGLLARAVELVVELGVLELRKRQ